MKVKIEIDTHTFVRFWLVVIGFVLAGLAIWSAQVALIMLGSAFFIAMALNPPVNAIARRLPSKSRVAGTAISYIVVLILLAAIIFLVILPIVQQTAKLIAGIPSLVNGAIEQYGGLKDLIYQYNLQSQLEAVLRSINGSATALAGAFGSNLIAGISSVFSFITSTILVLVLAFLMLIEGPVIMKKIWSLYVDKERMEYHRGVIGRMYTVVTGYVTGQLAVSAVAGAVAGVAVFILSLIFNVPLNFAIPTAAIIFVLSLIPLFGAMIGAALVSFILAFNDLTAAVIFLVFFIIYQQVEANYISPKIQAKHLDLSALAILVAITVGIYTFGIIGGIISIPIAGTVKILVEEYFARRRRMFKAEQTNAEKLLRAVKD